MGFLFVSEERMAPTGPNCDMTFEGCVAWAEDQDSIDDPEAYCGARERD